MSKFGDIFLQFFVKILDLLCQNIRTFFRQNFEFLVKILVFLCQNVFFYENFEFFVKILDFL